MIYVVPTVQYHFCEVTLNTNVELAPQKYESLVLYEN